MPQNLDTLYPYEVQINPQRSPQEVIDFYSFLDAKTNHPIWIYRTYKDSMILFAREKTQCERKQ